MNSKANQIVGLYRRHALAWAMRRGTYLPERKWLAKFLALLPDRPNILDIGCGSGDPIARHLLGRGCSVTGVDSSPELLEMARDQMPSAIWKEADMRNLDLTTKFDGILAWNSTFHLTPDDQRKMFPIFERHASGGAALMFTSGPANGESIGDFEGEALYHASLDPAEYETLLDQHGFEVVEHVVEDPTCNQQTIWLARSRTED